MMLKTGLIVATVLTLFFLPALYAAWFRVKRRAPEADRQISLRPAVPHQPAAAALT